MMHGEPKLEKKGNEIIMVKNLFSSQKDYCTVTGNNHLQWKSPSWPFSQQ